MVNGSSINRGIVLACICICLSFGSRAQFVPGPKVASPNATSLEKFGDIPVDMSTGVPNISIPIHTLKYGNISVPVSLRYHPANVRIAQHPGWVGLGWDLESIGSITRKVNMFPDECYGSSNFGVSNYYPEPLTPTPESGSEFVDVYDWNTPTRLASYFQVSSGILQSVDVCADEFSFNFLGYSGKFYFASPSKGWQVSCDQNVKIEFFNNTNPFFSGTQIDAFVDNYPNLYANLTTLDPSYAFRVFAGFKLTTPDGTAYYFGGTDNSGNINGLEFRANYSALGAVQFECNTWLLTKIVDVDGNEVDFQYSGHYAVADLGFGYYGNSWSCAETGGEFLGGVTASGWRSGTMDVDTHSGYLSLPLYLDKITCPNETIAFSHYTCNACLRLTDNVIRDVKNGVSSVPVTAIMNLLGDGQADPNNPGHNINGPSRIQWDQLNTITITNGNTNSDGTNQLFRKYTFDYSSDITQRLRLQHLFVWDNAGNSIAKYAFSYIPDPTEPSALIDGNYTDHWGFFNGKTVAQQNPLAVDTDPTSIFAARTTVPAVVTTGLMTSMTYPTGGYSNFSWEAHDYSQVVSSANRTSLTSQTGFAGGSRIKEVQSYLADGSLALDKKYFYVKGYTAASPNGHVSSGILNGNPTYFMNLGARKGVNNTTMQTMQSVSLTSLGNYSYNAAGSYIGYDEVAEVNADGSYTRNLFTNYDADLNGNTHFDLAPQAVLGWQAGDNYYPMTSTGQERGKPMAVYKYTPGDVLVQKTILSYRNDPGRFNNIIRSVSFGGSYSGCSSGDALIFSTANGELNYDFYLTNQTVTDYDQSGGNPISTTTGYTYNLNNLISTKTEINSKGESLITTYYYPTDFTDATSTAMTAAHILNPVLKTTTSDNGAFVNLTQTNYYSPNTGMFKPQSVQTQVGTNPLEFRQQFYQYDAQGNIQEVAKTNDIHTFYVWGYHYQYPVAKIEGATLSQVTTALPNFQSLINTATGIANNDGPVRTLLQSLRSGLPNGGLPNALVTTYTYLPLTGITSETDPKGQITYYQYDSFQRLHVITDHDGNVLKTFNYQYQIAQ